MYRAMYRTAYPMYGMNIECIHVPFSTIAQLDRSARNQLAGRRCDVLQVDALVMHRQVAGDRVIERVGG